MSYTKFFVGFLWLMLYISNTSYPQQNHYIFQNIDFRQGLSQNSIYAINQDSTGYIWLATADGLNRYDGYSFIVYRYQPNQNKSISDSRIRSLALDHQQQLWIGTEKGLNRYVAQADSFVQFLPNSVDTNSLTDGFIHAIYCDLDGILWLGTDQGGLNYYDPLKNRFGHFTTQNSSIGSDRILAITGDSTGNLWLGSNGNGLIYFDRQTRQFKNISPGNRELPGLPSYTIYSLTILGNRLWIGCFRGGLHYLDLSSGQIMAPLQKEMANDLEDARIYDFSTDGDSALWIATWNGLGYYNLNSNTWQLFQHQPADPFSLSDNSIRSVFRDHSGLIWVGTYGSGVCKLNPAKKFSLYRCFENNMVWSIQRDPDDDLWVGTNSGAYRISTAGELYEHFSADAPPSHRILDNRVWSILHDYDQSIWIGSDYGLSRINRQSGRILYYFPDEDTPRTLSNGVVWTMLQRSDSSLWFGTNQGLNRFQSVTDDFDYYFHSQENIHSLTDNHITHLYEDSRKRLWVGTSEGLNLYRPQTNDFIRYLHQTGNTSGLSHNYIMALEEDRQGRLWVATYGGGINLILNEEEYPETLRCRTISESDGLISNSGYALLFDTLGQLWYSSTQGLSCIDRETLKIRNYDAWDGLQSNEFNAGAYFRDADDRLFFGGINGITAFYSSDLVPGKKSVPVTLTGCRLNDEPINPIWLTTQAKLELSWRDRSLWLKFALLDFFRPEKHYFMYEIHDITDGWTDLRQSHELSFNNLPSGNYTLQVRGYDSDGQCHEKPLILNFSINPPPWASKWAYFFYLFVFIGGIAGIIKYRDQHHRREIKKNRMLIENLKDLNELKDQFLANTTHELKTPLNGIIGLAQSLRDGISGEYDQIHKKNLDLIVQSGKRLLNLVNDILDFSRLRKKELALQFQPVNLFELVENLIALNQSLVEKKNVMIENQIPVDFPSIMGDPDRLQQIFQNLVGNAIKFTHKGRIVFKGFIEKKGVTVVVSDTGIGISSEKMKIIFKPFEQGDGSIGRQYGGTGLGLAISHDLVQLHHGQISVQSKIDEGSQFSVFLPYLRTSATESDIVAGRQADLLEELNAELSGHREPGITASFTPGSSDDEQALPNQPPSSWQSPLIQDHHLRMLVVDDEPINIQVLLNYLRMENMSIDTAENGDQALEKIIHSPPFDLVLLDIMMPGLSGFDVCREIRKKYTFYELPVLMLTALNRTAELLQGFSVGANDYVIKPFEPQELIARIRTLVTLKQAVEHAIQQAEILKTERQRRELTEILHQIALVLNSTLDAEQILNYLLDRIQTMIPFEIGVALYQQGEDWAAVSHGNETLSRDELRRWLTDVMSALGAEAVIKQNFEIFPGRSIDLLPNVIYLPLVNRNRLEGMALLSSPRENAFSQTDLELAKTLCAQAAIALDNAILFQKVNNLASYDELTHLFNRRRFYQLVEQEIKRAKRYEKLLSIMMIDLDHFKAVNDRYGHKAGDLLLKRIADIFLRQIRDTDSVARWGGEEFTLLLVETPPDEALFVAERIQRAVADKAIDIGDGMEVFATVSIGITTFQTDDSFESFMQRADMAMYRAKANGRNRVESL